MKRLMLSCLLFAVLCVPDLQAQQFVTEGQIEYEVKTNIKKTMGSSSWAERLQENLPQFKTAYYQLTFTSSESMYKFSRWPENNKLPEWIRGTDEENTWYTNHVTNRLAVRKNVAGSNFFILDSLRNISWKLSNETRIIAGYTCRKATGIIMDSIYVFAFYTDEILLPGGPAAITGLPGTILGLTIPRMYTSYIATKVSAMPVNASMIKAPENKKTYSSIEFMKAMLDRTKDWYYGDDDEAKDQKNQFIWGVGL